MKKSGRVINFDDKKVYVITDSKEFATLERNDESPVKGAQYEGYVFVDKSKFVKIFAAIIVIALIGIACIYFIFFTAKAKIIVNIRDNIKIGINDGKIVSVTDINGEEHEDDKFPSVKGAPLNDGLCLLFDYYYSNEIIPATDQYSPGDIIIYITQKSKSEDLSFDKFKEYVEPYNYEVIINNNDNVLN